MSKQNFDTNMSPLTGSGFLNSIKLIRRYKLKAKYYPRAFLFLLVALLLEPFRIVERLYYNRKALQQKMEQPPIFIIGHWRSGTTHLHNLICQDENMGFVTTYQAIYPETTFCGSKIIKGLMQLLMPKKRAADNMALNANFPQEDEFVLTNTNGLSYYNFWFFPKYWKQIFSDFVDFNVPQKTIAKWKQGYQLLVHKALKNTNGKRFISKNPPNTGRIKQLLELYPDAKFIHIHRNPVSTFVSTKKFITETMNPIKLEPFSEAEIEEHIFWTYEQLLKSYLATKHLIPKKNLIDISFVDLESRPMETLENIYQQLGIEDFDVAAEKFKTYLNAKENYQKNSHIIPDSLKEKIYQRWAFAFEEWHYPKPNIQKLANQTKN